MDEIETLQRELQALEEELSFTRHEVDELRVLYDVRNGELESLQSIAAESMAVNEEIRILQEQEDEERIEQGRQLEESILKMTSDLEAKEKAYSERLVEKKAVDIVLEELKHNQRRLQKACVRLQKEHDGLTAKLQQASLSTDVPEGTAPDYHSVATNSTAVPKVPHTDALPDFMCAFKFKLF